MDNTFNPDGDWHTHVVELSAVTHRYAHKYTHEHPYSPTHSHEHAPADQNADPDSHAVRNPRCAVYGHPDTCRATTND